LGLVEVLNVFHVDGVRRYGHVDVEYRVGLSTLRYHWSEIDLLCLARSVSLLEVVWDGNSLRLIKNRLDLLLLLDLFFFDLSLLWSIEARESKV